MSCPYMIWNSEKHGMDSCNKPTQESIVARGFSGYPHNINLCTEHAEFVIDAESEAIQTSQGLMHPKTIKALFATRNKRLKYCPRCGYVY